MFLQTLNYSRKMRYYINVLDEVLTSKVQITCKASVSFVSHYNAAFRSWEQSNYTQCNRLQGNQHWIWQ